MAVQTRAALFALLLALALAAPAGAFSAVDSTPPALSINGDDPPPGQGGWFTEPPDFDIRADDASGVASVTCTPQATDLTSFPASPYLGVIFIEADGVTTISCTAKDGIGNTSSPTTKTVKLDTQGPDILIGANGNFGSTPYYDKGPITLIATGVDIRSGLAALTCTVNGSPLTPGSPMNLTAEGPYAVACQAKDVAGNSSSESRTIAVDSGPPSAAGVTITPASPTGSNGWYSLAGDPVVGQATGSDAGSGIDHFACAIDDQPVTLDSANKFPIGDGDHTVACTAFDRAGYSKAGDPVEVKVDRTKPTVTITHKEPDVTNATYVLLTVHAGDATSGAEYSLCQEPPEAASYVPQDGPVIKITEKAHAFSCTTTDDAGNTSDLTTSSFTIDRTKPLVSFSTTPGAGSGPDGWFNASDPAVSGKVAASDALAGLASYGCTLDAGAVTLDSADSFAIGEGTHTVVCTATDLAGNTQTTGPQTVKIDRTPPVFSPPAGITTNPTAANGAAVTYATPAGAICTPASGSQFAIGTTTVTCTATDQAGNATTHAFTVKVLGAREILTGLVAQFPAGVSGSLAQQILRLYDTYPAGTCAALDQAIAAVPTLATIDRLSATRRAAYLDALKNAKAALGCKSGLPALQAITTAATTSTGSSASSSAIDAAAPSALATVTLGTTTAAATTAAAPPAAQALLARITATIRAAKLKARKAAAKAKGKRAKAKAKATRRARKARRHHH